MTKKPSPNICKAVFSVARAARSLLFCVMRRGQKHYSLDRKRAAVEVYRHVQEYRNRGRSQTMSAEKLASVAAGGASRQQIHRWLKQDLSIEAQEAREERRGSAPLLSDDQLSLLVGFACSLRQSLKPVSLDTLTDFCNSHLTKTPSRGTLSNIMSEHGFSSQKSMSRNSRMVTESVVDDALDAIEELRSYGFERNQLLFMDETGVWSNSVRARTYHFSGWCAGH